MGASGNLPEEEHAAKLAKKSERRITFLKANFIIFTIIYSLLSSFFNKI